MSRGVTPCNQDSNTGVLGKCMYHHQKKKKQLCTKTTSKQEILRKSMSCSQFLLPLSKFNSLGLDCHFSEGKQGWHWNIWQLLWHRYPSARRGSGPRPAVWDVNPLVTGLCRGGRGSWERNQGGWVGTLGRGVGGGAATYQLDGNVSYFDTRYGQTWGP